MKNLIFLFVLMVVVSLGFTQTNQGSVPTAAYGSTHDNNGTQGSYYTDSNGTTHYNDNNGTQGTYYTDSNGTTHYNDNNGTQGTYYTDSIGTTHYNDNNGKSSEIRTDSNGNTTVRK